MWKKFLGIMTKLSFEHYRFAVYLVQICSVGDFVCWLVLAFYERRFRDYVGMIVTAGCFGVCCLAHRHLNWAQVTAQADARTLREIAMWRQDEEDNTKRGPFP
jgi:hypothetical protein